MYVCHRLELFWNQLLLLCSMCDTLSNLPQVLRSTSSMLEGYQADSPVTKALGHHGQHCLVTCIQQYATYRMQGPAAGKCSTCHMFHSSGSVANAVHHDMVSSLVPVQ